MSSPRYRNDIRHERKIVRLRRIDRNLYRLTAAIGRAVEYRKRTSLPLSIAAAADVLGDEDVLVLARLNHSGRSSILGLLRDSDHGSDPGGPDRKAEVLRPFD